MWRRYSNDNIRDFSPLRNKQFCLVSIFGWLRMKFLLCVQPGFDLCQGDKFLISPILSPVNVDPANNSQVGCNVWHHWTNSSRWVSKWRQTNVQGGRNRHPRAVSKCTLASISMHDNWLQTRAKVFFLSVLSCHQCICDKQTASLWGFTDLCIQALGNEISPHRKPATEGADFTLSLFHCLSIEKRPASEVRGRVQELA